MKQKLRRQVNVFCINLILLQKISNTLHASSFLGLGHCGCNCFGDMNTHIGTVTVVSGRCQRNWGRLGHHLNGGPVDCGDWVRIGDTYTDSGTAVTVVLGGRCQRNRVQVSFLSNSTLVGITRPSRTIVYLSCYYPTVTPNWMGDLIQCGELENIMAATLLIVVRKIHLFMMPITLT